MLTIVRSWDTKRAAGAETPVARVRSWSTFARVAVITAVAESALLTLAGLSWIWARQLPVDAGRPARDVLIGFGAAAALAILNYALLTMAPPVGVVRVMRTQYREVFRPAFHDLRPFDIAIIATVVGFGEELFFRGVVQAEIGLVPAALLFGIAHARRKGTRLFGLWAACMGLAFGWMSQITGGLTAPITAHVVYDAAALAYVRWSAGPLT